MRAVGTSHRTVGIAALLTGSLLCVWSGCRPVKSADHHGADEPATEIIETLRRDPIHKTGMRITLVNGGVCAFVPSEYPDFTKVGFTTVKRTLRCQSGEEDFRMTLEFLKADGVNDVYRLTWERLHVEEEIQTHTLDGKELRFESGLKVTTTSRIAGSELTITFTGEPMVKVVYEDGPLRAIVYTPEPENPYREPEINDEPEIDHEP